MGRAGERDEGKIETTVIEQQFKNVKKTLKNSIITSYKAFQEV